MGNVHVRGGSVIPLQDNAMTTTVARTTPFNYIAALCPDNGASGNLFWDDGEQIDLSSYIQVAFDAEVDGAAGQFLATADVVGTSTLEEDFAKIPVGTVTVNGKKLDTSAVQFDADKGLLKFSNLGVKVSESFK